MRMRNVAHTVTANAECTHGTRYMYIRAPLGGMPLQGTRHSTGACLPPYRQLVPAPPPYCPCTAHAPPRYCSPPQVFAQGAQPQGGRLGARVRIPRHTHRLGAAQPVIRWGGGGGRRRRRAEERGGRDARRGIKGERVGKSVWCVLAFTLRMRSLCKSSPSLFKSSPPGARF